MAGTGKVKWDSATGEWISEPESTEEPESAPDAPSGAQQSAPQQSAAQPSSARQLSRQETSIGQLLSGLLGKAPQLPVLLLVAGILLAVGAIIFMLRRPKKVPSFEDLGAGISNVDGLRGNLTARWQGRAEYKLSFGPLHRIQSKEFSAVVSDPSQPLWINIRLLDATGFALCGKQILFQFDPAQAAGGVSSQAHLAARKTGLKAAGLAAEEAQEQQREQGKDIFQNQLGDNGKVVAVTAQGVLPCSIKQYRQASYWDFTTNFPSVDQQAALVKRRAAVARAALLRREARRYRTTFSVEGDSLITGYNYSTAMLETGSGQSFFVPSNRDRTIADAWAASNSLIHYKCTAFTTCILTHPGGGQAIYARSIQ
jgi:hypothetical protein